MYTLGGRSWMWVVCRIVLRQYRSHTPYESGAKTYRQQMDPAVCRAMAEGTSPAGRWDPGRKRQGHATGRGDYSLNAKDSKDQIAPAIVAVVD